MEKPSASWGEAAGGLKKIQKLALRRLNQMLSLEPKVLRADDPAAVHDFRVASRRLQQALDLLLPPPRQPEIRRLRRRIKRCRRVLSEVRNCDVFIERAEKLLAGKRVARREAWQSVRDYLDDRRAEAHARAMRKLSKLNLASAYVRLRSVLGRESPHAEDQQDSAARQDSSPPAQGAFRERLQEELERVWRPFEAQWAEGSGSPDAGAIHRRRIAIKKFRYLIEIIDKFGIQGSREALSWLRALQRILGDWHDLEVAEQMMAKMAGRAEFLQQRLELAASVLKLIVQERRSKERLRIRYREMTQPSAGGEQLERWVHALLSGVRSAQ